MTLRPLKSVLDLQIRSRSWKNISCLLALSCLTACSSIYNDTFDCGAGKGVPCKSISEVNTMVSQGEIGRSEVSSTVATADLADTSSLPSFRESAASSIPVAKGVFRVPEQTLRIWVAPHLEESGTWSGARYLYTVVTPGRWAERKSSELSTTSCYSSSTNLKGSRS